MCVHVAHIFYTIKSHKKLTCFLQEEIKNMAGKTQRLGKVAGELNVGISTLTEFLQSKGVSIDPNPNSKLEGEHYDLLRRQFADDQSLKEQAKLSAVKREKRETVSLTDAKSDTKSSNDDEEDDFDPSILEKVKAQTPIVTPPVVKE